MGEELPAEAAALLRKVKAAKQAHDAAVRRELAKLDHSFKATLTVIETLPIEARPATIQTWAERLLPILAPAELANDKGKGAA